MTTWKRRAVVFVVIAYGVASAACGDSPFAPGAPSTPSASPPQPPIESVRIRGAVRDTVFRPVAGARVDVVDGPQAGASTTSSANGEFSLTASFDGSTRFRASKEGHIEQILTPSSCVLCTPGWIYFILEVVTPPVNLAGSYTVTFVADSSCDSLPGEVRTRSYAATIAPSSYRPNTAFSVTFDKTPFLEDYKFLTINVAGNDALFWLGNLEGDPGLVERVAANTYFAFDGTAAATVTDVSSIAFSLDGRIESCELASEMGTVYSCNPPQVVTRATCASRGHRVILTRRE
jgi:hypothetical protein